eukprot:jgi/Mesvir1/24943/Mv16918-RA.1
MPFSAASCRSTVSGAFVFGVVLCWDLILGAFQADRRKVRPGEVYLVTLHVSAFGLYSHSSALGGFQNGYHLSLWLLSSLAAILFFNLFTKSRKDKLAWTICANIGGFLAFSLLFRTRELRGTHIAPDPDTCAEGGGVLVTSGAASHGLSWPMLLIGCALHGYALLAVVTMQCSFKLKHLAPTLIVTRKVRDGLPDSGGMQVAGSFASASKAPSPRSAAAAAAASLASAAVALSLGKEKDAAGDGWRCLIRYLPLASRQDWLMFAFTALSWVYLPVLKLVSMTTLAQLHEKTDEWLHGYNMFVVGVYPVLAFMWYAHSPAVCGKGSSHRTRRHEDGTVGGVDHEPCSPTELSQRERDRQLAYTVHELKTPLHGILGLLHTLQEPPPLDRQKARRNEVVQMVIGVAKRMLTLISDILDSASCSSNTLVVKSETLYLDEILAEICKPGRQMVTAASHLQQDGSAVMLYSRLKAPQGQAARRERQINGRLNPLLTLLPDAPPWCHLSVCCNLAITRRAERGNWSTMLSGGEEEDVGVAHANTALCPYQPADESNVAKFEARARLSIAKKLVEAQGRHITPRHRWGGPPYSPFFLHRARKDQGVSINTTMAIPPCIHRTQAAPYKRTTLQRPSTPSISAPALAQAPHTLVSFVLRPSSLSRSVFLTHSLLAGRAAPHLRGVMAAAPSSKRSTLAAMGRSAHRDTAWTPWGAGQARLNPVGLEEGSNRRGGTEQSVSFAPDVRGPATQRRIRLRRRGWAARSGSEYRDFICRGAGRGRRNRGHGGQPRPSQNPLPPSGPTRPATRASVSAVPLSGGRPLVHARSATWAQGDGTRAETTCLAALVRPPRR